VEDVHRDLHARAMLKKLAERVRIEQHTGAFAFWESPEAAQRLIDRGAARAIEVQRQRYILAVRFLPTANRHDCPLPPGRRLSLAMLAGMRTVTRSESDTNPPRCWTFRPQPTTHRFNFGNEKEPKPPNGRILLADARAALRRRLADPDRTELSHAFAAWLLREPQLKADLVSLVAAAAEKKGAQQYFQTVAILGYGSEAGVLDARQIDALRQGLRRQAGREPFVDGVPMAFCQDAVGILGVALGVKAVADGQINSEVVRWTARFLKSSYDMERAEDWHRCLFAAADQQLGSPQNLSVPPSAAVADLRTVLVARGVLNDEALAAEDSDQTLRLALTESQADLPIDRAMLRLAAMEFVIRNAAPTALISGMKSK